MPALAESDAPETSTSLDPLPGSLEDVVLERLRAYAQCLQGHEARDLYDLIMPQLERPLVRVAMELAGGRQLHAAAMLGIHRNTLRKRLDSLGLDPTGKPKPESP